MTNLVSWKWKRFSKIQHSYAYDDPRRTELSNNCTRAALISPRIHTASHWFKENKRWPFIVSNFLKLHGNVHSPGDKKDKLR